MSSPFVASSVGLKNRLGKDIHSLKETEENKEELLLSKVAHS